MERITHKHAERAFEILATEMGKQYSPKTPAWTQRKDGTNKATVGVWMLDHNSTYGGYVIAEMSNEDGGENSPLGDTRMGAREFVQACHMAARAVRMFKGK